MRVIAWLLTVCIYCMLTLIVIGAVVKAIGCSAHDPASAARQDICIRMWQDAAPGWEKRTAREMCDRLGVRP